MKYHLFEVVGIELEYMVVASNSLTILPIVDELLTLKNGNLTSDIDNGSISWSNELVAHVVELKTNGPVKTLNGLTEQFHENVQEINTLLKKKDSQLLPTASHPFMNPSTEMHLWKHSYSEVYALYNRIFNCKGHGWANVQSMHINLPFYNDEEFGKLHAAIRVLLPIIPGLSASSPIFDGKNTGFKDARMEAYKTNQKEIPVMAGKVIPEQVFTKNDYTERIFNPINAAIKPFDTEGVLDHHFLNSRGAIARFDRNAIEIRVIDIQECPKADIAIASLLIETLKWLIEKNNESQLQQQFHEDELFHILNEVIRNGEEAIINNAAYLALFSIKSSRIRVSVLWEHIFNLVKQHIPIENQETIEVLLKHGTLSTRILKAINGNFERENLVKVYQQLAFSLEHNQLFVP